MNTPEQSTLGKAASYPDRYDPGLLFPIPRAPKRAEIGVAAQPPFMGADLWTAYELSWLNARGKPQVAVATVQVPCTSPRLIESKSFKLYLNSLNSTRIDSAEALRLLAAHLPGTVLIALIESPRGVAAAGDIGLHLGHGQIGQAALGVQPCGQVLGLGKRSAGAGLMLAYIGVISADCFRQCENASRGGGG
jgi:NADPH-dependent 7-cyano-7-deazaguanine reductase QueF-like protein